MFDVLAHQPGRDVQGEEYRIDIVPKVAIDLVVDDAQVNIAVEAITQSAATGKIGDGKVWVTDTERRIRIRTGEEGTEAA